MNQLDVARVVTHYGMSHSAAEQLLSKYSVRQLMPSIGQMDSGIGTNASWFFLGLTISLILTISAHSGKV